MVTTMMSPRDDQPAAVVDLAAAAGEPAAVDPHHHRSRRSLHRSGVHTLRRQAVLIVCFPNSRSALGSWMQRGPDLVASRTPIPCRRRRRRRPAQRARPAVPRKGFRRTAGDPHSTSPRTVPVAVCTSEVSDCGAGVGTTGDGASVFPGWPTSAMPRRAVRAQPPAPSPSRRSGPPAGFEPSLAARSPSLRRLSLQTAGSHMRRSP